MNLMQLPMCNVNVIYVIIMDKMEATVRTPCATCQGERLKKDGKMSNMGHEERDWSFCHRQSTHNTES